MSKFDFLNGKTIVHVPDLREGQIPTRPAEIERMYFDDTGVHIRQERERIVRERARDERRAQADQYARDQAHRFLQYQSDLVRPPWGEF